MKPLGQPCVNLAEEEVGCVSLSSSIVSRNTADQRIYMTLASFSQDSYTASEKGGKLWNVALVFPTSNWGRFRIFFCLPFLKDKNMS